MKEGDLSIWKKEFSLEYIHKIHQNTMVKHLGIEIIEVGDNFVKATMPVGPATHQPMGLLHGGASVTLAETVGSVASNMVAGEGFACVGLEINANHIRGVRNGLVTAIANPVHIGRSTQVWDIQISDEQGHKVCVSRLTVAVLEVDSPVS